LEVEKVKENGLTISEGKRELWRFIDCTNWFHICFYLQI
jgi:hypothetical protein